MKFLFVLPNAGGNAPPLLELARRLVSRGHAVRIMTQRRLEPNALATGGTFVPFDRAPDIDTLEDPPWRPGVPFSAMRWWLDELVYGPAAKFAADVQAELRAHPADCAAVDMMLPGAVLGALAFGTPVALLVHHIYPRHAPGLPPTGFGLLPASGVLGRLRDEVVKRAMGAFLEHGREPLNRVASELGFSRTRGWELNDCVDRVLVLTSAQFDFPATRLPENVRYVGPIIESVPSAARHVQLPTRNGSREPLVAVALSTVNTGQRALLQRLMRVLGRMPVRGFVTLGGLWSKSDFVAPPNVVVENFVPHQEVFENADLVVCHGGHGTVMKALLAGAPILCLPFEADQFDSAARIVWRKVGIWRSRHALPRKLGRAIRHVLEVPSYRECAARIALDIQRDVLEDRGVAELEMLATQSVRRSA
jgi:MGT family glycosyltransferase